MARSFSIEQRRVAILFPSEEFKRADELYSILSQGALSVHCVERDIVIAAAEMAAVSARSRLEPSEARTAPNLEVAR